MDVTTYTMEGKMDFATYVDNRKEKEVLKKHLLFLAKQALDSDDLNSFEVLGSLLKEITNSAVLPLYRTPNPQGE